MRFLKGWWLTATVSLLLTAACAGIVANMGFTVEAMQSAIRFTARTSFFLFALAFSASALFRLWPGAWSRWQRQNRRHLGVSFAASHLLHALALAGFATIDPRLFHATNGIGMYVAGGLAYVFIILMTATSFDATAKLIGPRAWRLLHLAGSYYIAFSFLTAFGKRIVIDPLYAVPVAVLIGIFVLRAMSWSQQKNSSRVQSA